MPYTETTLAAFRDLLTSRWDGSAFWSDEEARLAINEVLRDWNLLTGRWRQRVTFPTLSGNPSITIATSIVYGMRVRTPAGQPVWPTSIVELDLMRPTWRLEITTSGGAVPTRPTYWAPESLQRIVIWPATAADSTIDLDGVADTPVLVQDADYADVGGEILDILADAALHVAAFKEGGPRWRQTRPYWQAFLQAAAEENTRLKASQTFKRIAGLDRRRDLHPTHRRPSLIDGWGGGQVAQAEAQP